MFLNLQPFMGEQWDIKKDGFSASLWSVLWCVYSNSVIRTDSFYFGESYVHWQIWKVLTFMFRKWLWGARIILENFLSVSSNYIEKHLIKYLSSADYFFLRWKEKYFFSLATNYIYSEHLYIYMYIYIYIYIQEQDEWIWHSSIWLRVMKESNLYFFKYIFV